MSFRKVVAELKQPHLYKLVFTSKDGKREIKGFRVRVLQTTRGRGAIPVIKYFDFTVDMITDTKIQRWVTENKGTFDTLELIPKAENNNQIVFITQDELDGKVETQEFMDDKDANKVLSIVMQYYQNQKDN